jgi:hypothetical protein
MKQRSRTGCWKGQDWLQKVTMEDPPLAIILAGFCGQEGNATQIYMDQHTVLYCWGRASACFKKPAIHLHPCPLMVAKY